MSLFSKVGALLSKVAFILKRGKTRLVLKLLRHKVSTFFSGIDPPFRHVEIQTTFACNLECAHCSAAGFKDDGENLLSIDDYRNIAEQCKKHEVPMVSFTGGEPLHDNRLADIISVFDTSSTLIAITTNGVLLTEEKADKLQAIGVDAVCISLDGSTAEENDAIRGEGTYDAIMKALEIAKARGFYSQIIYTINHQAIANGDFDKMIKLAQKMDVVLHVSIGSPTGNWASEEAKEAFILTDEDRKYLAHVRDEYGVRRDLDGNYSRYGCPGGTERFVISPYGDVLPCTKIQSSFGNLRNEDMMTVRNRMANHPIFKCYQHLCLVAEDEDFLETYLPRLYGRKDLPVPYEEYYHKGDTQPCQREEQSA